MLWPGKNGYSLAGKFWFIHHTHQTLQLQMPIYFGLYNILLMKKKKKKMHSLSQLSSVTQSCLTLCDPMDCSMPGLPVHHQLQEFTQTHVH